MRYTILIHNRFLLEAQQAETLEVNQPTQLVRLLLCRFNQLQHLHHRHQAWTTRRSTWLTPWIFSIIIWRVWAPTPRLKWPARVYRNCDTRAHWKSGTMAESRRWRRRRGRWVRLGRRTMSSRHSSRFTTSASLSNEFGGLIGSKAAKTNPPGIETILLLCRHGKAKEPCWSWAGISSREAETAKSGGTSTKNDCHRARWAQVEVTSYYYHTSSTHSHHHTSFYTLIPNLSYSNLNSAR